MKPTGNTITLQLDELLKNEMSPETIAKEVQAAVAEYYAEQKRKELEEQERQEKIDYAQTLITDGLYDLLEAYNLKKDRDAISRTVQATTKESNIRKRPFSYEMPTATRDMFDEIFKSLF